MKISLSKILSRFQGAAALAAYNVFHPLTYEGAVDVDTIADPVMRAATIAQISSYGQVCRTGNECRHKQINYFFKNDFYVCLQTPKQLFTKPHVKRRQRETMTPIDAIVERYACYPLWAMAGCERSI